MPLGIAALQTEICKKMCDSEFRNISSTLKFKYLNLELVNKALARVRRDLLPQSFHRGLTS